MNFELEIIGTHIHSCVQAEKAGATRIELCAGLCEGGITPSYGLIREAVRKLIIPVHVMIRPRGGDFLYSDDEFDAMKQDVRLCKSLGAAGIVTGLLKRNGSIDIEKSKQIVELAYPLPATFHRAFDRARNPEDAIKAIIDAGFERILSSGQAETVVAGTSLLTNLIQQFGNDIIIMPGAGIDAGNIAQIAKATGATEFHLSAKLQSTSAMEYINSQMNEELKVPSVDMEMIKSIRAILESL